MGDTNDKETTLTEEHVIIIACVCGVIIVSLLIILFCFIFRRRRNAAKAYQGGNQGDPPPYNAVPPSKKPQAYDNQDGPLDLYMDQHQQFTPSPGNNFQPWSRNMGSGHGHVATVSSHTYRDEPHLKLTYNNGIDGYPNRDTQDAGGVPQSPSKDKYIGLQDRGGGGDPMIGVMESGYVTGDLSSGGGGGKPKKVIYEVVV